MEMHSSIVGPKHNNYFSFFYMKTCFLGKELCLHTNDSLSLKKRHGRNRHSLKMCWYSTNLLYYGGHLIENIMKNLKMRFKKNVLCLLALILILSTAMGTVAMAGTSYAGPQTFEISEGDGYTTSTTSGTKLKDTKLTDTETFTVMTEERTMITKPYFAYFNSNDAIRSEEIKAPYSSMTASGDGWGTKNYYYYGGVKPNSLQSGTDSITLKFFVN